jgi:pyruvate/2-oxoglutarate dehydrogenase complex dihydrolipoamide dehydrogenase (E3) component
MSDVLQPDICVIGAGSAGLSVAAGASQMGARTVLIEAGEMGGDCLNYGCVPSKALLASAKAAAFPAHAKRLGVDLSSAKVDFHAVHEHVHGVIRSIAPMDSQERFEGMGVTVIRERARFTAPREVMAGDKIIRARRFVIATGSSPLVPPIAGLDTVDYLTNETVFSLSECPASLIVMGGGPIGCELGLAFRRLGAEVTIVEMASILPKDDPELVDLLRWRLEREGIHLAEGRKATRVEKAETGVRVAVEDANGGEESLTAERLLVAAGRMPNVRGLGLEEAGIAHGRGGIEVDARLRTSDRKVFAMGDVAGGPQFTHLAGYHAGVVIKNALFRLPAKADHSAIPWVTYTEPELAHVGMTEAEARERAGTIHVLRWPFSENDRAACERETEGLVKVVTNRRGRILGCSILGQNAGELLLPWVLAVSGKERVGRMAQVVAPYPTLSEASKRAAGSYYTPSLFSDRTRKIVRFLSHFG